MSKLAAVTAKDQVKGGAEAKVTLVEYGDYQCPSCGQAAPIVQRVQKHFGDKLRFVFRNFPLEQHEFAEAAAETAMFAAAKGKFWEMHDLLYKHQDEFSDELFPTLAQKVGLDEGELTEALEARTYGDAVERDLDSGEEAGVAGTPSFFVNGEQVEGGFGYEALVAAIEAAQHG